MDLFWVFYLIISLPSLALCLAYHFKRNKDIIHAFMVWIFVPISL
jgi:hypothetical protein